MKTNNVDFGKSFKFRVKESKTVYIFKQGKGFCIEGVGKWHYCDDAGARKAVEMGGWIVLPCESTDNSHNTEKTTEDNLLDEIKAFTATSNHSVFIHEGYFEVYQAGLTEFPYKCKDDKTLRSVMQALKVLDGVTADD